MALLIDIPRMAHEDEITFTHAFSMLSAVYVRVFECTEYECTDHVITFTGGPLRVYRSNLNLEVSTTCNLGCSLIQIGFRSWAPN